MAGRKMEARITEFEAEKKLTLKFTAGPVKGSTLTYSLEPVGGDTRLTRDLDMKLSGLWRLMGPILSRREVGDREAGVANIKHIIEAQTDAGTSPLRR
jgi:carbon monoxide dehydrogenase subunit G